MGLVHRNYIITFLTVLCGLILPSAAGAATVTITSDCDSVTTIEHFTLTFDSVTYNTTDSTSQWCYSLTWDGTAPALSHFSIEICSLLTNDNLVSAVPSDGSIGPDGSTGLYSIKWDSIENFPANTPVTFCFTLDQMFVLESAQFAPKAGINSNIADICGPSTECDVDGPCFPICPASFTISNDPGECGAIVTYETTLSENCSGATISCDPPSGSFFPVGVTTVTCTSTDASGNTASCSFDITVVDTEPPVPECPDTVFVQCVADIPAPDISLVAVTDNCDPNPVITLIGDSSDGLTCPETITRTYRATDSNNNSADCIHIIIVNDTIAPVLSGCPSDITLSCDETVPVPATVSATDNCDAGVTVLFDETTTPGACPQSYTITRTWTATDSCGNSASCSQTITVADTTAPLLSDCPADITIECDAIPPPATVTATDNCDPDVPVMFSESEVSGVCPQVKVITRTWTATDDCNNTSSCSQTITVVDTTPPEPPACPPDTTVECDAIPPPADLTTSDNCDGIISVICVETETPGNCPQEKTITRTYTATDACGNSSSCSQIITVVDTTPPVLSGCPANITVECDAIPLPETVTATDNCDPDVTVTFLESEVSGVCPQVKVITRTWTAIDDCNNTSSCSQTITVVDTTPPVPECPTSFTVSNDPGQCGAIVTFVATVSDNCPGATISCEPPSGSFFPVGITTVTCTATDSCGNSASCTFDITVFDTEPPVPVCPASFTVPNDPGQCGAIVTFVATVSDNCPGATISCQPPSGSFFPVGVTTVTCTATDASGNTASCTFDITVNDTDNSCIVGCPQITIEKVHDQLQGVYTSVAITIDQLNFDISGFDLLMQYDNSALAFISAEQGLMLDNCAWEYFTYRFGAFGNCGSGCPSNKIRIVAIADLNDGVSHPSCNNPGQAGSNELFVLTFLVSNDRTLECQYTPIRFCWLECGDNSMSDISGDTLYISSGVFDYVGTNDQEMYIDVTDQNSQFPSITGSPSECGIGDKNIPVRCLEFFNGGIDIICAENIDDRGDINLNGLAYEIADVVMFTNYFLRGLIAFDLSPDGSIAASDVNADGLVLTVADLVYLIRVVIGDAMALPKVDPGASPVIEVTLSGDRLLLKKASQSVGGIYVEFEGEIVPSLPERVTGMNMQYEFDGSRTRVLIQTIDGSVLNEGEAVLIIDRATQIISVDAGSIDGLVMASSFSVLPQSIDLDQNFPNPFNPTTTISFALPDASEWTLSVFNSSGQLVQTFSGVAEAGTHRIEWDAGRYASGVYFYRLRAGEFSATRKMVLLK